MLELALNLLALIALIGASFLAVRLGAEWLTQRRWHATRERILACAQGMADALKLARGPAPDPRMDLWHGQSLHAQWWLATGAHHLRENGQLLSPTGPVFADGRPTLAFRHLSNVLMVARFMKPLPIRFSLTTMYGVPASVSVDDAAFDGKFKLNGDDGGAIRQLFADSNLRASLVQVFGDEGLSAPLLVLPGGRPRRDGTGVMLAANEHGMVVYWHSPRPTVAAEFAVAVATAGDALAQAGRTVG